MIAQYGIYWYVDYDYTDCVQKGVKGKQKNHAITHSVYMQATTARTIHHDLKLYHSPYLT